MTGQWEQSLKRSASLLSLAILLHAHCVPAQQPASGVTSSIATVQQNFLTPPDDARIMMRWWWFGPAVTKPEIEREILAMKAGGIGGFEIQPVYPMALDDADTHFRNLPYLSDDFLSDVTFAAQTARANGMRVDMTLNSGWPYGGAHVSVDQAAAKLRVVAADLPANAASLPLPAMGNGESLIAAFAGNGGATKYDADQLRQITVQADNGRVAIAPVSGPRVVVFYIASRTGQQVKRAAVGAEGFVLDPYSRAAIDNHLKTVGEPLMRAFGDDPPYAVFSDSLEVYGADWTDDLLPEFQRRRGYDLTPYLPQLASGTGELSAEVRHDWGLTLTELADERYLTPINDWAAAHHTRFRSQNYGIPPVSLSSNNLVALPEGEGPQWKSFSFTRLATSASHLYGRPITSSETWTWLHSPAFRATPLDMKAEADCFFLEGINQIIGHGWPYTPPGVAEPGWSFYAAAVFNDHNPWWIVMPDLTKYLQRMSYILRQGKPANDVAVLLPNDDVYAQFKPGNDSLSAGMHQYVTDALTQQIESSGYNLDYIDADAIHAVGIQYPVLVLPHIERIPVETMQAIAAYVAHGGKVIAIGAMPSRAPGFAQAQQLTAEVQRISQELASNKNMHIVAGDSDLGSTLQSVYYPDVRLSSGSGDIGFIHRKLPDSDIYFLANTSNQPVKAFVQFRSSRHTESFWDPFTGEIQTLAAPDPTLQLAPYESRVIVFTDAPATTVKQVAGTSSVLADWTRGWSVTYAARGENPTSTQQIDTPASWTANPDLQYFSGVATYTKTVTFSAADLAGAKSLILDFGEGTPIAPDPQDNHGTHALLASPVPEAAVILINGKRIGSVWHPPYTLDLTGALHPGKNTIEIQVANTDMNNLAGRAPADYHLLTARYGERFVPQDINLIAPLPSGILGTVRLLETK
jgi:hypothetical protein